MGLPFEKLRRAAEEMPILIYPVALPFFGNAVWKGDPGSKSNWIDVGGRSVYVARTILDPANRARMQALADASGGRLFTAKTLEDLKPVAAQVADELRSVYTLTYYPKNTVFDGKWRDIEVRIKRPEVTLRTRRGYYAR